MTKYSDINFLPREIRYTPVGARYESACLRMRMRAIEINIMFGKMHLGEISRDFAEPIIYFYRREYFRYSNLAHAALDVLTKTYNWPPESTADESFTWTPAPVPRPDALTSVTPQKPLEMPAAYAVPNGNSLQARLSPLLKQGYRLTKVTLPQRSLPDR